jgi:hypothetical protein
VIAITDRVDNLLDEYVEQEQYVEEEKPYWLFLDATPGEEMQYSLFNYFPSAHYEKAIDQAFREVAEERLESDGGTTNLHLDGRRSNVFYWLNPDTGAALYHTEINDEEADPFFGSIGEAEQFLEKQGKPERYEGLSLYKARVEKVEDAVEVLMDQSGIDDFW